jgi:hypothetical protein
VENIALYFIISLINVFLHITRSILVIKSNKFIASLANCICYTFSAIVIKFIAEVDLWVAITVQATTNFIGCYIAMVFCEKMLNKENVKSRTAIRTHLMGKKKEE